MKYQVYSILKLMLQFTGVYYCILGIVVVQCNYCNEDEYPPNLWNRNTPLRWTRDIFSFRNHDRIAASALQDVTTQSCSTNDDLHIPCSFPNANSHTLRSNFYKVVNVVQLFNFM